MTIGINTSPLAGREGTKLTARLVKSRLDQELVGNVSLRVRPDRPPRRLGGRTAAASSSSRSSSRRCAARASSSPSASRSVVTRTIDGKRNEPMERVDRRRARRRTWARSRRCSPRARASCSASSTTAPGGSGWTGACRRAGSSACAPSSSPRRAAPASSTTSPTAGRRGSATLRPRRSGVDGRGPHRDDDGVRAASRSRSAASCSSGRASRSTRG